MNLKFREWDESKVRREEGRFAPKSGGSSAPSEKSVVGVGSVKTDKTGTRVKVGWLAKAAINHGIDKGLRAVGTALIGTGAAESATGVGAVVGIPSILTGAALWGVAQFIGGKATDAIVDKIESTNWGAVKAGRQTPVTMSEIGRAAIQFGEWTEEKHPRDENGHFRSLEHAQAAHEKLKGAMKEARDKIQAAMKHAPVSDDTDGHAQSVKAREQAINEAISSLRAARGSAYEEKGAQSVSQQGPTDKRIAENKPFQYRDQILERAAALFERKLPGKGEAIAGIFKKYWDVRQEQDAIDFRRERERQAGQQGKGYSDLDVHELLTRLIIRFPNLKSEMQDSMKS